MTSEFKYKERMEDRFSSCFCCTGLYTSVCKPIFLMVRVILDAMLPSEIILAHSSSADGY